uniref:Uncharacterized protein n=1 Tax=Oryza glumipatula TaxID=40148 RepID=A0A0E0BR57_9ORYZ
MTAATLGGWGGGAGQMGRLEDVRWRCWADGERGKERIEGVGPTPDGKPSWLANFDALNSGAGNERRQGGKSGGM